ncbi:MAG: sulfatase-like hydrolase/transferase [Bacteroidota bacterium]
MKTVKIILLIILPWITSCSGFRPFNDEEAVKISIYNPSQVVIGKDSWQGREDCSAHAYLNKTTAGLLFTIEVYDDSIRTGNPASYMNDGIELYMDLRPPRLRENNYYQQGVFQAVILPEPGKKQIAPVEWFPKNYDSSIPGTRAYTELRDSGYVVQVSIPYSSLRRKHYWPRNSFYFDVAINDADTGRRESQMMWAGESDNWKNPHNFANVSFDENIIEKERPNIVLILTDQQTIGALSAYGNPYLSTPFMDALAKYGIRFTNSYCTAPVSGPSRSSIITGRMPHETQVNYNGQSPDSSILTLGQMLKEEGYETTWAGKWHLPELFPHTNQRNVPGFELLDFTEEETISYRGDDTDKALAEEVVKHIKGRRREPFLLVVSFQNPGDISAFPFKPSAFPPPANIQSTPPLPDNFTINPLEPGFLQDARNRTSYENSISQTSNFGPADWRNYLHHYYQRIEKVDAEIGRIIKALEYEGMDQNTLIVFTSTNGEGAASHQWAGNLSLYQECVRVPLIITRFGKTESRTDNENLVSGLDITPTLLDYAEAQIPVSLRGKSLRGIIEKPDTIWRDYLVTELAIDPQDSSKTGRMITDKRYKYNIYSYGNRNEQLFDLAKDPGEARNLAYNPAYAEIKRRLRQELKEWIRRTGDHFSHE